MRVVVDTSAVIAVLTNEPVKAQLIEITRDVELLAPASLRVEIGNAFSAMFKRGRISSVQAQQAVQTYQAIPIQQVDIDLGKALDIAYSLEIYAYDAYMIDCAQRHRAPLLTLDRGLREAAKQVNVNVLEV